MTTSLVSTLVAFYLLGAIIAMIILSHACYVAEPKEEDLFDRQSRFRRILTTSATSWGLVLVWGMLLIMRKIIGPEKFTEMAEEVMRRNSAKSPNA